MLRSMFLSFFHNRAVLKQFTKREVVGRYKGSHLGLLWTFINPILMLVVYTFVFSEIFNARWGNTEANKVEFALIIFTGLTVFNIFSEVISRAPGLIVGNSNLVTKVVFPLEILPISILGSSLIHACINLSILLTCLITMLGVLQWTLFLLPLVLLPLLLMTIGLSWILASLGVYLRDLSQFVGIVIQAIMLLSPIFYSVNAVPENLKFIYYINPISYVVEDTRRVVIWGQMPQWSWLGIGTLIGAVVFILGYIWFNKTKSGFSDVL
ncbi:ABC transporter permease [Paenibacillus sp. sgz302251]|uniref:ABC transporter permease n=1 Tax=Paenibacillus sp. sgz302251 TaxID=3414493 RepID=UPI003C7DE967